VRRAAADAMRAVVLLVGPLLEPEDCWGLGDPGSVTGRCMCALEECRFDKVRSNYYTPTVNTVCHSRHNPLLTAHPQARYGLLTAAMSLMHEVSLAVVPYCPAQVKEARDAAREAAALIRQLHRFVAEQGSGGDWPAWAGSNLPNSGEHVQHAGPASHIVPMTWACQVNSCRQHCSLCRAACST